MSRRRDHTILTSTNEQGIDRDIVAHFRETFGTKSVEVKSKGETIESLTLPRDNFRRELKKDSSLRAIVRASETRIQDVHVKPLSLGEVMDAKVYVKDAKAVGASKRDGSAVSLSDSISRLHDVLSEWGQVKIPALILLLLAGGTLYGAYRLGKVAMDMGEDYANQVREASESDKGLERVLRARAGRGHADNASTSKPTDSQPDTGTTSQAKEPEAQQKPPKQPS